MSPRAAKGLHSALILIGLVLYLLFVLPRWWVLTGDIPSSLATAGRLAAGIPIALAALPVLTMLRQALGRKVKPPELALRLRAWSAVLYVVAGALILLAAIAEIWLHLGAAGPYLFAVYGAAASIAILAALALYLSFVAEKPPAEPKPPKAKKVKAEKAKAEKKPRGKKKRAAESGPAESGVEAIETPTEAIEDEPVAVEAIETVDVSDVTETDDEASETEAVVTVIETETETETTATGLRNKRPEGKKRRLLGR